VQVTWQIHTGDAAEQLALLPAAHFHCVVTSPPYWGLRDYGTPGQLGLEPTPAAYLARMTAVFREVRRVLRPDGVLWLNMGDCYAHGTPGGGSVFDDGRTDGRVSYEDKPGGREKLATLAPGLKPKDLVGMPWRLAFALQADGWYLRSDCIWCKPNPMPESVTDRPTKAHEYVFLLSARERYFYDADAVREAITSTGGSSFGKQNHDATGSGAQSRRLAEPAERNHANGRNLRSWWPIPTQAYPQAHFATFPERLVEPCIKTGTSERGCCPQCGQCWERIVEVSGGTIGRDWNKRRDNGTADLAHGAGMRAETNDGYKREHVGWIPACDCPAHEPEPCRVLDPFAGSGTVGKVATRLGRSFIGIELNPAYVQLARQRIHDGAGLIAQEVS
jgi:DNA modification methylase